MKSYLIMFILIMMILIPSCSREEITYEFPMSREVVESVIQEKGLDWKITDEQYREFQSSFVIKKGEDEPGRSDIGITILFNSIGNEEERYLSVQMMYPNNYSVEQIQNEQVENLPLLIDIATRIYGIENSAKNMHSEFLNYINRDVDYEKSGIQWEKDVNGTHLLVRMSPLSKDIMYKKCSVLIMNDVSYERFMNGIMSIDDAN